MSVEKRYRLFPGDVFTAYHGSSGWMVVELDSCSILWMRLWGDKYDDSNIFIRRSCQSYGIDLSQDENLYRAGVSIKNEV